MFSPALVNDAKFGVNQEIYHSANVAQSPLSVTVSQFSPLTGASTSDAAAKTFSNLDDVSWMRNKHILKFGYEIRWIQMNQGARKVGHLLTIRRLCSQSIKRTTLLIYRNFRSSGCERHNIGGTYRMNTRRRRT